MTGRRRWLTATGLVAVAAIVALLAWVLLRGAEEPLAERAPDPPVRAPASAAPVQPVRAGPCDTPPTRAFVPRTISVEGVVRHARVLAMPRDAAGVVGVPPVSDKTSFAWDDGGVRPGDRRGHLLLNTHTWPDGSATGNALLREVQPGARIVVRGDGGRTLCYRVTRRDEVREEAGYPGWDAADGPPRLVIVVCSGERLGPGQWTHRTLWFARPVSGPLT